MNPSEVPEKVGLEAFWIAHVSKHRSVYQHSKYLHLILILMYRYVKCKSVPPKMKMSHSVDVKTSNGAVQDSGEDSTPYKIEVEHTTVEFDIKIYRRM